MIMSFQASRVGTSRNVKYAYNRNINYLKLLWEFDCGNLTKLPIPKYIKSYRWPHTDLEKGNMKKIDITGHTGQQNSTQAEDISD